MTSDLKGPGASRPIAPCLEEATLQQLLALDDGQTGLLLELFGLFQDDTPDRLDGLEKALAAGDAQATAELAHALKGAAGTIGATRLRGLAQELEKEGKSGSVEPGQAARIGALRAAYAEACAALGAFLAQG